MRPRINNPLVNVLKNRTFRLLWCNGSISGTGDMSELLAMGWIVHQITGSPWQVALVGLSRTVAMFSFTLLAGAIGDRKDRRHIIMASNTINVITAVAVLVMLILGNLEPYYLFIVAAVRGASRSFDNTSRRALIFHVVGPGNLVQAISLEQIGFSIGRIAGPLAIGALLQITGTAVSVYSLLAGFYLIALTSILLAKVEPMSSSLPRRPVLRSIGEGLKYAYSTPAIAGVLTATVVMNAMFQYHLFIPVIAQEHLGVGPGLMGLLAAADGIGFVVGSLIIGLLGSRVKIHGKVFLTGCLGVTILLLGFALSPWFLLSLLLLITIGVFQVGFATMQSGILLTSTPSSLHSRVFGAQGMAVGAGQMGNVEIGALAAVLSIGTALAINAGVGIVLLILIAIIMPALRGPIERVDDPPDIPPPPPSEKGKAEAKETRRRHGIRLGHRRALGRRHRPEHKPADEPKEDG